MRFDRVSMSPSVRSSARRAGRTSPPAPRRPASGSDRSGRRGPHGPAARPCGSRAPGRPPRAAPPPPSTRAKRWMSSSRARISSAARSSRHRRARIRPCSRGCSARLSRRRREDVKSRSGLRHCSTRDGIEVVVLQRLDGVGVEGRAAPGGAEGAVAHVPAGAAGDLAELGRVELAEAEAVELLVGRRRRRGRRRG